VPGISGSVALVTNTTSERSHLDYNSASTDRHVPGHISPRVSDHEDSDVSTSSDRSSDTSPLPSTSSDHVQCNEISSSEDSPSRSRSRVSESESQPPNSSSVESTASTSANSHKSKTNPTKSRPSLSRELSSLQLSSPKSPKRCSTRSQMSSTPSSKTPRVTAKKHSHTPKGLIKPSKRKVPMQIHSEQVQPNRINMRYQIKSIEDKLNLIEQKVSRRTSQIAEVKPLVTKRSTRGISSDSTDTDSSSELSPKILRSRTPVTSKSKPRTPTSVKRKRTATPKREMQTRKSPRTIITQIPKVTHSKQAKVLKLKK